MPKQIDPWEIPTFLRRKAKKDAKLKEQLRDAVAPTLITPVEKPSVYANNARQANEEAAKARAAEKLIVKEEAVSVAERTYYKASDVMANIEIGIDDGSIALGWSLYNYLTAKDLSKPIAQYIYDRTKPCLDELVEALAAEDEQLVEGYRGWTREAIEERAALYLSMTDEAERFIDNAKRGRKPRKKKAKTADKVVKKMKFATENKKFQLVSIDPIAAVGCQELWTFNPGGKILTVWRAVDRGGLTFKGTSVINYDENTSESKTTGRQTKDVLDLVLTGGKVVLRKLMEAVDGSERPLKRLSRQTILLRAIK